MESVLDILTAQLYGLLQVLPPLVKAIVIFLVGYVVAKVLYRLLRRILTAIGLDRLAERLADIDVLRRANLRLVPSRILAGIVYYFVLIVFTMAAVDALGMTMISELMAEFLAYVPDAILAFVILILGIVLADVVRRAVITTCRSLGIAAGNLIANAVFYFILLNVVLIALSQARLQTEFMETNISIMLAGIAAAFALGYGLASRHIMGNLLSAFYNRDRIQVGDEVSVNGTRGEVIQLSNVNLTLRTGESEHIIPFSKVTTDGIEIHSRRSGGPSLPPHAGS